MTRTSYARRNTEPKRDEIRSRSYAARWHNRTGRTIPEDKVNAAPVMNSTGSLRHHLARECGRYFAAEERKEAIVNGIISGKISVPNAVLLRHARAIVAAAIKSGLITMPQPQPSQEGQA